MLSRRTSKQQINIMGNTQGLINEDCFTRTSCDNEETTVVFRSSRMDDWVVALFPSLNYDSGHTNERGLVASYVAGLGQHGAADYVGTVASTRPATDAEYEDLAAELESLGYRLRILKKKPSSL